MNIVDIVIHVHPDLSAEQRMEVEQTIASCDGAVSVHFSAEHLHELTVAYNPEAIDSQTILRQVRHWDAAATMTGL